MTDTYKTDPAQLDLFAIKPGDRVRATSGSYRYSGPVGVVESINGVGAWVVFRTGTWFVNLNSLEVVS